MTLFFWPILLHDSFLQQTLTGLIPTNLRLPYNMEICAPKFSRRNSFLVSIYVRKLEIFAINIPVSEIPQEKTKESVFKIHANVLTAGKLEEVKETK